jgi:hypothetical protein
VQDLSAWSEVHSDFDELARTLLDASKDPAAVARRPQQAGRAEPAARLLTAPAADASLCTVRFMQLSAQDVMDTLLDGQRLSQVN